MTHDEAEKLCGLIPPSAYTRDNGFGTAADGGFARSLSVAFPDFNWRVILDRSGERSRWALTIDDNDPREHYFYRLGGKCQHCGKTARELGKTAKAIEAEQTADEEMEAFLHAAWQETQQLRDAELAGEVRPTL